ncbi:MAG TPA: TetR/AcrR family transcriptional regulator [Gemmatales bacterium]|nr:TetR/AcrR family transcriptional regulator [Gemmatales bacterium]HMP60223.1 TetR/AcrR family transcriptional regulator [Gemmatales bacterium]
MTATTRSTRPVGRPPDADRQERRRGEILDGAVQAFAQHGFALTDVQEIADRLGVGKGTVYRYFPSKEKLFLAAVDHGIRRLKDAVDQAVAATERPLDRIAAGIRAYLVFFDENPEVVELLIHERAHFRDRKKPTYFVQREANMGPWRELFQGLVAAGIVRDEPVDQIIEVVSNLVYGTMFTNYFAGRKVTLASQCESILNVVFHGILVRPEARP